MRRVITDAIAQRILELSVKHSDREVSAALATEGVSLSHVGVYRFLRREHRKRGERNRAAVQEHASATAATDLEMLREMRDQLNAWRLDEARTPMFKLMVYDRLRAVIADRLKAGGVIDGENIIRIAFIDPDEADERP